MPRLGGYSGNFNAGGSGRGLNPADPYYANKIVHIVSGSYTTSTTSTTTISNLSYDTTWSGSNFSASGNTITFSGQFSTVVYALRQSSGKVYLEFLCISPGSDSYGCYIGVQRQPLRAGNFHDSTSGNGNQGLGVSLAPLTASTTYGVLIDIDAQTVSWNNGTAVAIPGTGALYFGVYDGTSSSFGSGTVNWGVTSFVNAIPAGAVAAGTISTSSGGATNLAIVDTSVYQNTVTNTLVTQGSISPYGDKWSGYFGATGNYIYNANSAFNIGSATATWNFECWVYPIISVTNTYLVFFAIGNGGSFGNSFIASWDYTTTKFRFSQSNGSSGPVDFTTTNTYPGARWYHVAISCDANGVRRMYINGVLDGTQTYSLALSSGTGWIINGQNDNNGLGWSGGTFYISNVRFVVGTPLYTTSTSFTVPSPPLSITTQTQLLICQDNIFKDNSVYARTLTKTGTNSGTVPFNKFSPKSLSRLTDYSGGGYFNGSTTLLQLQNTPAITLTGTTWTIECWLRPSGDYSVYRTIFAKRASGSGSTSYEGYLKISTGVISYYNGTEYSSTVTLQPNTWSHCAWVYDATNLKIYVNGVNVFTLATTITELDQPLIIGGARGYTEYYSGWMSNFRMVKGTAVYTGNFTPPSKPLKLSGPDSATSYKSTTNVDITFPATNTSVFLEFANLAFYDQAGLRYFNTVGSTGKTTAVTKWSKGSINIAGGGAISSMYSTDPSPNNAVITLPAAFTIECWVYLNNSGRHVIVGEPSGNVTSTTYGFGIFNTSGANGSTGVTKGLCLILSPINNSGGNMLYSGQYPTLNQWTHVAVTRTTANEVMFFMDGIKGSTVNDNSNAQAGSNLGTAPNLSGSLNMSLYFGDFDGFTSGGNAITMASGFNGYIEDFAIYNGVAKYTATFTKPGRPIITK
jgi:hypothetical protein